MHLKRDCPYLMAHDCLHSDVRSVVVSLPLSPKAQDLVGESSENFFFIDFFFAEFLIEEKGFFAFNEERKGDLEVEFFNFLLGV